MKEIPVQIFSQVLSFLARCSPQHSWGILPLPLVLLWCGVEVEPPGLMWTLAPPKIICFLLLSVQNTMHTYVEVNRVQWLIRIPLLNSNCHTWVNSLPVSTINGSAISVHNGLLFSLEEAEKMIKVERWDVQLGVWLGKRTEKRVGYQRQNQLTTQHQGSSCSNNEYNEIYLFQLLPPLTHLLACREKVFLYLGPSRPETRRLWRYTAAWTWRMFSALPRYSSWPRTRASLSEL